MNLISATSLPGNWCRFIISCTAAFVASTATVAVYTSNSSTYNYIGSGTGTISVRNIHVDQTVGSTSNLTTNPTISYISTLSLPSMNDLSTGNWTPTHLASHTATVLTTSSGTSTQYYIQSASWTSFTSPGGGIHGTQFIPITIVIDILAGTTNTLQIYDNGSTIAKFRSNGIIDKQTKCTVTSIGSQAGGWWRYSITYVPVANGGIILYVCANNGGSDTWSSAGGDTISVKINSVNQPSFVAADYSLYWDTAYALGLYSEIGDQGYTYPGTNTAIAIYMRNIQISQSAIITSACDLWLHSNWGTQGVYDPNNISTSNWPTNNVAKTSSTSIYEDGSTGTHEIYQTVPGGVVGYPAHVYLEVLPGTRTWCFFKQNTATVFFNLSGVGTLGTQSGMVNSRIRILSDGWYAIEGDVSNWVVSSPLEIAPATADATQIYTGTNGNLAISVRNVKVVSGQVPVLDSSNLSTGNWTTSSLSSRTALLVSDTSDAAPQTHGVTQTLGQVYLYYPTTFSATVSSLLVAPTDLTNGIWSLNGGTATTSGGSTTFSENSSTSTHTCIQTVAAATTGRPTTFHLWVTAVNRIHLYCDDTSNFVWMTLSGSGSVAPSAGVSGASIASLGGGQYHITWTVNTLFATTIRLFCSPDGSTSNYTGNGLPAFTINAFTMNNDGTQYTGVFFDGKGVILDNYANTITASSGTTSATYSAGVLNMSMLPSGGSILGVYTANSTTIGSTSYTGGQVEWPNTRKTGISNIVMSQSRIFPITGATDVGNAAWTKQNCTVLNPTTIQDTNDGSTAKVHDILQQLTALTTTTINLPTTFYCVLTAGTLSWAFIEFGNMTANVNLTTGVFGNTSNIISSSITNLGSSQWGITLTGFPTNQYLTICTSTGNNGYSYIGAGTGTIHIANAYAYQPFVSTWLDRSGNNNNYSQNIGTKQIGVGVDSIGSYVQFLPSLYLNRSIAYGSAFSLVMVTEHSSSIESYHTVGNSGSSGFLSWDSPYGFSWYCGGFFPLASSVSVAITDMADLSTSNWTPTHLSSHTASLITTVNSAGASEAYTLTSANLVNYVAKLTTTVIFDIQAGNTNTLAISYNELGHSVSTTGTIISSLTPSSGNYSNIVSVGSQGSGWWRYQWTFISQSTVGIALNVGSPVGYLSGPGGDTSWISTGSTLSVRIISITQPVVSTNQHVLAISNPNNTSISYSTPAIGYYDGKQSFKYPINATGNLENIGYPGTVNSPTAKIREIIKFNRALTPDEIVRLNNYLKKQWQSP
jgi:hypothetical protein